MLEQHLRQLHEELEIDSFEPKDKDGLFYLELNPETKVSFREEETGGMYLSCTIAPCFEEKKEELFILLMRANYLGLGTGGSAIALDAEEKYLTLSCALTYDMNYKTFKETVEDFVNFLDYWRAELVQFEKIIKGSLL